MLCQRCRHAATLAIRQLAPALRTRSMASSAAVARRTVASPRLQGPPPYRAWALTLRYASSSPASPASPRPEKPDYLNEAESAIWEKLSAAFEPTELMVQDISGGCGSMYGIEITSEKFRGNNMLKQQRMVNAVLGDDLKEWHGVQLRTKVPQ